MNTKEKHVLRKQVIAHIKGLSANEKRQIEQRLANQLFATEIWRQATTIGITYATDVEWDTTLIIERAWQEKKTIAMPKVDPAKKQMFFYRIKSFNDLAIGYAKIKEPIVEQTEMIAKEQIDLLIVPGVVFDEQGYRIGFGGGYYDRFLADFKQTTVSLVSNLQLMKQIPTEKHDIPVQYIITEDACMKTTVN